MAAFNNNYWPSDLDDVEPFSDAPRKLDFGESSKTSSLGRMSMRFKTKKLSEWNREDIVDWVLNTCKVNHIESDAVNVFGIATLTGNQLKEISEDRLIDIEPVYGRELYMALRPYQHWRTSDDSQGLSMDSTRNRYFVPSPSRLLEDLSLSNCGRLSPFPQYDPPLELLRNEDLSMLDTYENMDDLTPDWDFLGSGTAHQQGSSPSQLMNLAQVSAVQGASAVDSPTLPACNSDATSGADKRRRTRSSTNKPRERGKKVWEFLLDLLMDPSTNPSLIRWEDEAHGVFRLVEHELVAQKWGARRDRSDLSYDYFARTMRYQYTTGMLESVPERKLVFRFGPKVLKKLNHQM
ncbi:ETS-related transcription factor Elf-4-like [Hyalella azteca]|uniref:ETS-related transcription factor Elf-4-like n=1 Tax=Hyalella azteca TaxID=294128 RepID=A0A8B7NH19_HYAAZ|nr:ETS-related transcription factor Elf-4-like [Hyalella azteca]